MTDLDVTDVRDEGYYEGHEDAHDDAVRIVRDLLTAGYIQRTRYCPVCGGILGTGRACLLCEAASV